MLMLESFMFKNFNVMHQHDENCAPARFRIYADFEIR